MKYGRLEVLSTFYNGKQTMAVCRCDCGVEKTIRLAHVRSGVTVSCGCVKRKHHVSPGQKFGRLTVETGSLIYEYGHLKAPVICECGTRKFVGVPELCTGITKSCGCLVIEQISSLSYKHGGEGSVLYAVWQGMKTRCINSSRPNYHLYGGRGISVCDEWIRDFNVFRRWACENGYEKGLQIDRIDVNGDYCPENCRWVTPKVNGNNRRDNVLLCAFGEEKTMKMWSEDSRCVVSYTTLKQRISKGKWPAFEAITTESRKYKK